MWQIKNNCIPETISKLFKEKDRTYGEGDNQKIHVPNVKLEIVKRSIFYQGPEAWNVIPSASKNKKILIFNDFKKFLSDISVGNAKKGTKICCYCVIYIVP